MAKKRPPYERRLISLPHGINSAMKDHPDVNWSEVAQIAFEKKLAELDPVKQLQEMEATVKRLREQVAAKQGAKKSKRPVSE